MADDMNPDDMTPDAMPTATADDIAQLYDAYAALPKPDPAAQNPTAVFPNPADLPAGALPAALEFDGLHGRIICPLDAVPSAALLAQPSVMALADGLHSIKFDEQPDGNWTIYLQGSDIHCGVRFALAKAELEAMLARDGVTLPGKPSDAEFAAAHPATDADAPPF